MDKFSTFMLSYIKHPEQDTIALKKQLATATYAMLRLSVRGDFEVNVSKLRDAFVQTAFANQQQRENARKKMDEEIKVLEEEYRANLAKAEELLNKSPQNNEQQP